MDEHVVVDPGSTPYGETDTCDRPLHFLWFLVLKLIYLSGR